VGLILDREREGFFEAGVEDRVRDAGLAAGEGSGTVQEGAIEG